MTAVQFKGNEASWTGYLAHPYLNRSKGMG